MRARASGLAARTRSCSAEIVVEDELDDGHHGPRQDADGRARPARQRGVRGTRRPQGPRAPGEGRRQRAGLRARVPARQVLRVRRSRGDRDRARSRQPVAARELHPPRRVREGEGRAQAKGQHRLIDKVDVRLVASEDKFWAHLVELRRQVRAHPGGRRLQVRAAPAAVAPGASSTCSTTSPTRRRRSARSTSARSSRSRSRPSTWTSTSPGGARFTPRRVARPRHALDRPRAGRLRPARQAARAAAAHPDGRAQLQPDRARAVGHRQVLRLPRDVPERDARSRAARSRSRSCSSISAQAASGCSACGTSSRSTRSPASRCRTRRSSTCSRTTWSPARSPAARKRRPPRRRSC